MSETFTAHVSHAVMAADIVFVNGREIPAGGVSFDEDGVSFAVDGELIAFLPNQNIEIDRKGHALAHWTDVSGAVCDAPCDIEFRMIVPLAADNLVRQAPSPIPMERQHA